MRPSEKSFDQVKNILGKLERNIDELRSRRENPEPASGTGPAVQPLESSPARPGQPAATSASSRVNSAFGRATPMRPTGS